MGVQNTFSVTRYGFNTWRPEYQGTWVHCGWEHGSKPIQMVYRTRDIVVFKVPGLSAFASRGKRTYGGTYLSVEGILHEDQTEIKTITIVNVPVRSKPIDVEQWREGVAKWAYTK